MNEILFPKHVTERLERRWAARLARDAATWRGKKPSPTMTLEIVDRKGRLVPVASSVYRCEEPRTLWSIVFCRDVR